MEIQTAHGPLRAPCYIPDATRGFVRSVEQLWPDIERVLVEEQAKLPAGQALSVRLTGHSLGGALARAIDETDALHTLSAPLLPEVFAASPDDGVTRGLRKSWARRRAERGSAVRGGARSARAAARSPKGRWIRPAGRLGSRVGAGPEVALGSAVGLFVAAGVAVSRGTRCGRDRAEVLPSASVTVRVRKGKRKPGASGRKVKAPDAASACTAPS